MANRKKKRMTKKEKKGLLITVLALIGLWVVIFGVKKLIDHFGPVRSVHMQTVSFTAEDGSAMQISEQFIPKNEYSRPGTPLTEVTGVVVHYIGNPGTTAQQNHDWFASLASSGQTYASSHFLIGLDGEIIQNIPLDEVAYCSNEANSYTISIECCHPDESGVFTEATYESLVHLTSWLMQRYSLNAEDVIRHYDVTGKVCPKAFVDDPAAWDRFRADIASAAAGVRWLTGGQ